MEDSDEPEQEKKSLFGNLLTSSASSEHYCTWLTASAETLDLKPYKKVKKFLKTRQTYVAGLLQTFKPPHLYYVGEGKRDYQEGVKWCQKKEGKLPEVFGNNIGELQAALQKAGQDEAPIYLAVTADSRAKLLRYQGSGNAIPPFSDTNPVNTDTIAQWSDDSQCLTLAPATGTMIVTDCDAKLITVCTPADTLKETIVAQAAASTYMNALNEVQLDDIESITEALSWDPMPEEPSYCELPLNDTDTMTMNSALGLYFDPSDQAAYNLQLLSKLWPTLLHDMERLGRWTNHLRTYTYLQYGTDRNKCVCTRESNENPTQSFKPDIPGQQKSHTNDIRNIWATVINILGQITKLNIIHNIKTKPNLTKPATLNQTIFFEDKYFRSTSFWVDLAVATTAIVGTIVVLALIILRKTCRRHSQTTNHQEATAHYHGYPSRNQGGRGERRVHFTLSRAHSSDSQLSDLTLSRDNGSTRGSSFSSLSQNSSITPWFALLERLRNQ